MLKILKIATLAALVLGRAAYGNSITYSATLLGRARTLPSLQPERERQQ